MLSFTPATQLAAFSSWAMIGRRTRAFFLFSVAVILMGGASSVRGQFALDDFDPNANDEIHAVAIQPDGKVLIGGRFTTLSPNGGAPVMRKYIARLNPDGTIDTAFNPDAIGHFVTSIVVQADGKILVGGDFNNIGGQIRNHIARLDPTTGLADSFNPNANAFVFSIAVQGDGKILAGGAFSQDSGTPSIGGQTRNRIARLDATTGLADSFDPNASGSPNSFYSAVYSIVLQKDGKILAGGNFTSIGGQTRNRIARLDATTGTADSFNPNPNPFGGVNSIAVQTDGKILVGGDFTTLGGQARNRIARLDPTTGLADSLDPNVNGSVMSIAVQADGKIIAGGGFSTIGGQARNRIARLDPTTGLADSFDPNANGGVYSIAVQVDGKILVGGGFSQNSGTPTIGGQTRNFIARFSAPSATPTPAPPAQALNFSTRMFVQTGNNVGIGGFIIAGSAPKYVLLRGLGPSTSRGFNDVVDDPVLELHGPGGFATITNDDWRDTQEEEIEATGIPPTVDLESAIVATLAPGAYTAVLRGNQSTGSGLVEIYDLSQAVPAKLANISTRAFVQTDNDIVVAGFILGGNSGLDRIVVRGIGPSLTALGVPDALANPGLDLRDANGTQVFFNNDWQDDPAQAAEISAAGLAPTSNLEAGIAATLPPDLYTVLLFGENDGTGVGLVEVYDLGAP